MTDVPIAPDAVLAGRYRLREPLGHGGMATVYRATDERLGRDVAVKVFRRDVAEAVDVQRIQREMRLLAGVQSPYVVTVFDAVDSDMPGLAYLVLELVDGSDLRTLLDRPRRPSPEFVRRIVADVAMGLEALHGQGVVHRDVKPANVLVETRSRGEHAYLTDFGLTKYMGSTGGLTRSGMVLGTVDYMPPEQLNGDDVDARADVYALGCVLFEALTGRVPYPRGDPVARMYAHVFEPPPRVSDVVGGGPITFDPVIARALAKNPDERYPSAGDLARAMLAAAGMRARAGRERSVATGAAPPA
jgi:serine/threonine-protein kinase